MIAIMCLSLALGILISFYYMHQIDKATGYYKIWIAESFSRWVLVKLVKYVPILIYAQFSLRPLVEQIYAAI